MQRHSLRCQRRARKARVPASLSLTRLSWLQASECAATARVRASGKHDAVDRQQQQQERPLTQKKANNLNATLDGKTKETCQLRPGYRHPPCLSPSRRSSREAAAHRLTASRSRVIAHPRGRRDAAAHRETGKEREREKENNSRGKGHLSSSCSRALSSSGWRVK